MDKIADGTSEHLLKEIIQRERYFVLLSPSILDDIQLFLSVHVGFFLIGVRITGSLTRHTALP